MSIPREKKNQFIVEFNVKKIHINCFTFYHSMNALNANKALLRALLIEKEGKRKKLYNRKHNLCSNLETVQLPFMKNEKEKENPSEVEGKIN